MIKTLPEINLYTDGACLNNPGFGGWGVILAYNETKKELCGGEPDTTNNRMELTAAIEGLKALKKPCRVNLYTDSKYLCDGLEKGWAKKWRANNWIKSDKKPALNPDLWETLLDLSNIHEINLIWIKGHAGHPQNERCDELATGFAKALKQNSQPIK